MSTSVNLISCNSSTTFMLSDIEGEYFSCTLPRSDISVFQKALGEFVENFDTETKKEFETDNVSGDMRNLGEFIILECKSKINSSGFRMMLDIDTSKVLQHMLIPELEKSTCMFGDPPKTKFSWGIFSTAKSEIED
jgi:hypothetical protein